MEKLAYGFALLGFLSHIVANYRSTEQEAINWELRAIFRILLAILVCLMVIAFDIV